MELRVLLLCENEKSAALDKRAIRDTGYGTPRIMISGIEAARLLAGLEKGVEPPEIVVCSHKLADMDGEQFCAIIREHPALRALPILLLMPNEEEARRLDALGCGASAILGRPYSLGAFAKIMHSLREIARIRRQTDPDEEDKDTRAFDMALSTYGILLRHERQPEDFFRAGMNYLKEKRWNFAISAFEMAMREPQFKAEAEMGLAAAYKGKGDVLRFRSWLGKASETFVRDRRWQQARNSFARLLQQDPAAKNPFMTEAHRLMRLNDYAAASDALVNGLELIPKKHTGDRYARLCLVAGDPEAMRRALEEGLSRAGGGRASSLAEEIRRHMEIMTQEKKERERLQAVERKWRLARKMATQKQAPQGKTVEEAARAYAGEEEVPSISGNADASPAVDSTGFTESTPDAPVLMPLVAEETGAEISTGKRISDMLSVMKLTWKLARKSKNK